MKVDGVSFNISWVKKFPSAELFAGHKSNAHLWPGISADIKKQRLLLVYELSKLAQ